MLEFFGHQRTHFAFINNLVDAFGGYFCRGGFRGDYVSHSFRFQNNTLRMKSKAGGTSVTAFKHWGRLRDSQILDNVIDLNASTWDPAKENVNASGIGCCQGSCDWIVRGNVLIDLGVRVQPNAVGFVQGHRRENILIDGNLFWSTSNKHNRGITQVSILGLGKAPLLETVGDITVTNNIFYGTSTQRRCAISSSAGNGTGPQEGTITISGNTMYGPVKSAGILLLGYTPSTYPYGQLVDNEYRQQSYVIRNNIIATTGGRAIASTYAPGDLIANGNVYGPSLQMQWNEPFPEWRLIEPFEGTLLSFEQWREATGQDSDSIVATPMFVDVERGDLGLRKAFRGVPLECTDVDFYGNPRSKDAPVVGAIVKVDG